MRKHILFLVAITGLAGAALPATAAAATPDGRCAKRMQSAKLSAAGKAKATTACQLRDAAIRNADAALRDARTAHATSVTAANDAYRAVEQATSALPAPVREPALATARAFRDAALKSARETLRTALRTHRRAIIAAQQAFRTTMEEARAA